MRINGWHRLWILLSIVFGFLYAMTAFYAWMNTIDADAGKIARGAVALWATTSLSALLVGHVVAWVVRGFRERPSP